MTAPARILMTADAVGGVWTYAVHLGRELGSRGVRTTLAVMGPPPTETQRADAWAAGLDVVDRSYRLEWMDDPWDDVARAGEWLLDLERQVKPSVVHLNGFVHGALPWRSPVVVVAHSCVRTWWRAVKQAPPPACLDRYTAGVTAGLLAAQVVVAPTHAMGRALTAEYGIPLSVQTVPNGAPPTAPLREGDAGKEEMVLAAGRLWDDAKNIAALCDVAGSLDWPVYVAGDAQGPDGSRREAAAVRTLGRLPASQLAGWYRRASIYVLPARYEPFGLSVLEAAGAGCALVLGDIPTLRENWDGAAVFVRPDDRAGLSEAIRRLMATAERSGLGRRAQARAGTFTLDRMADGYFQLYQTLVV